MKKKKKSTRTCIQDNAKFHFRPEKEWVGIIFGRGVLLCSRIMLENGTKTQCKYKFDNE